MTAAQNATIRRATFAAHRDIEKLDTRVAKELIAIYKRAVADLRARIQSHAGADGNIALQELQSVLAQANARLRELSQARDQLLGGSLETAADIGVKPLLSGGVSATAAMTVSNEALAFVRNFVAEDGLQLSDRIWRLDRQARDGIVNAIEQAVIQGHGAAQASAEMLARGMPVPEGVASKLRAANAAAIGVDAGNVLIRDGGAMENAMRLFRTEINRAHGEAFMAGANQVADFAGFRYLLSPAHPAPDICDLLSAQNLYGLGPGVYPTREKTPWPAHPNTLSFLEIVFKDEISAADREGRETSMQALARLSRAQQLGVLGKGKLQIFDAGALTKNMIRAPLAAVRRRIGGQVLVRPREVVQKVTRAVASTVNESVEWLQKNVARTVDLPKITLEQITSIRRAFEDVLVPQGVKIGALTWGSARAKWNAVYRYFVVGGRPGTNDAIEFRQSYARAAQAGDTTARTIHAQRRANEIQRIESMLAQPDLTPAGRAALKSRLEQVRAATRWSISTVSEDALYTTAAHEAGHALQLSSAAVDAAWRRELAARKVTRLDMLRVSEYAATNKEELFAEVTAALATGRRSEIPKNILLAYDAAMKAR